MCTQLTANRTCRCSLQLAHAPKLSPDDWTRSSPPPCRIRLTPVRVQRRESATWHVRSSSTWPDQHPVSHSLYFVRQSATTSEKTDDKQCSPSVRSSSSPWVRSLEKSTKCAGPAMACVRSPPVITFASVSSLSWSTSTPNTSPL
jgi:hypothetical protein